CALLSNYETDQPNVELFYGTEWLDMNDWMPAKAVKWLRYHDPDQAVLKLKNQRREDAAQRKGTTTNPRLIDLDQVLKDNEFDAAVGKALGKAWDKDPTLLRALEMIVDQGNEIDELRASIKALEERALAYDAFFQDIWGSKAYRGECET